MVEMKEHDLAKNVTLVVLNKTCTSIFTDSTDEGIIKWAFHLCAAAVREVCTGPPSGHSECSLSSDKCLS